MSLLRLSLPLLPLRRSLFTSTTQLSGHNKWSKIKEKKGANDLQKGAVYSKANRDIALAVRNGGGANPEHNATLAAVLKRVKSQGVPKDNIENAIKKAVGGKDKGDQHLTYEAMAPGSIGIIIECLSDNVNRTMHSLHNILKDHSARFAPVGFLFQRKGCVKVALDKGEDFDARTERLIEAALEAEAEDFEQVDTADDTVEIEVCPALFDVV
ncbi:hypothetical protein AcV7_009117 [Taiwanofungus camphoratus]|nr:hypothetical protein AcV7_009117 [Antrodia cinnamomea]